MSNPLVIMVDSDEDRVTSLTHYFEDEAEVLSATSLEDAQLLVAKHRLNVRCCIVCLDIEGDPFYFLSHMMQIAPYSELLVFSKEEDEALAEQAIQAGAYYYFHEPFQEDVVAVMVSMALKQIRFLDNIRTMSRAYDHNTLALGSRMSAAKALMAEKRREGDILTASELARLLPASISKVFVNVFKEQFRVNQTELEKPTLLIIEDDNVLRNRLFDKLDDRFDVFSADNARSGIKKASELKQLDIVLMDALPPDMLANRLLASLRESHPRVPIILITGYRLTQMNCDLIEKGADDFINEPFNSVCVLTAVSRALQRRELRKIVRKLSAYQESSSSS